MHPSLRLRQISQNWRSESQRASQLQDKNKELEGVVKDLLESIQSFQSREGDVQRAVAEREKRIAEIHAENASLKASLEDYKRAAEVW